MPAITFTRARNFTPANRGPSDVKYLVIHDMEYPERLDSAERVANWFAGRSAPRASAHFNIDVDSIVQSVRREDVAWACPGFNRIGIQYEHAGYARQTRDEWLDDYGKAMLDLSAWLVARDARDYDVPLVKRSPAELRAGKPGLMGHVDATKAGIGGNTHTDPGKHFPWDYYESLLAKHSGGDTPRPRARRIPGTNLPILRIDGWLGGKTIRAVQTLAGTPVDGVLSRPSLWVEWLQEQLNEHGHRNNRRHRLNVDGLGIQSNEGGRYPKRGSTNTLEAAQGWLHTSRDGYLSAPSDWVRALQRAANRGEFDF